MRLYNLRAYDYLNAWPEVDQVLHERGLIEERMVLAGGNITKASEITEDGLQLLEYEDGIFFNLSPKEQDQWNKSY